MNRSILTTQTVGTLHEYEVTEERACKEGLINFLFDLLKSNMEALYGEEWSDEEKRGVCASNPFSSSSGWPKLYRTGIGIPLSDQHKCDAFMALLHQIIVSCYMNIPIHNW